MAGTPLLWWGSWLTVVGMALGQMPADPAPGDAVAAATAPAASAEAAPSAVSSNPGADNIITGTGALGRLLGFDKDSGITLGGAWIADANCLASGGLRPGDWSFNSLTLLDFTLDADKVFGIKGGLFGMEFLQFSGQHTNGDAGVVQGYNGLPGPEPLVRQELYELWYRQVFFDGKLIVRVGKSVPTFDFNNVSRPVPSSDVSGNIPSVTGLIYTPIFKNPTLFGKMPGYYNSATGIVATLAPSKHFYFSYGVFDGTQAIGSQTGLRGPQFDGHYFHIGEAGAFWTLGAEKKPGKFSAGIWRQTGPLTAVNHAEVDGAGGVYLFGSQRLWYLRPGVDNSGVSGFYQFGANNSNSSIVRQYCGAGLTGFGLVPSRPKDSLGCGMAWSWLNTDPNAGAFFFPNSGDQSTRLRSNELMFQTYYQMQLGKGAYFQPVASYIPNPGERPDIPAAWALTARLIFLF